MKITDIKASDLPIRVKLNDKFTLEESLDKGTIIQINNFKREEDGDEIVYEVFVTCLNSDMEHNKSIAIKDWYDSYGHPVLDFFDCNIDYEQKNCDYKFSIFVMDYDDCFDLIKDTSDESKCIRSQFNYIGEVVDKEIILESNKLLAIFDGAYFVNDDQITYPNGYWMHDNYDFDFPHDINDVQYNRNYNWIMDIVERIEKTDCSKLSYSFNLSGEEEFNFRFPTVEIVGNSCRIYFKCTLDHYLTISDNCNKEYKTKLEAIWFACVEFVKWYNLSNING